MEPTQKKTAEDEFNLKILTLIHTIRPFEEIVIRKSDHGKPGTVIVTSRTVTILDPDGEEVQDRRK